MHIYFSKVLTKCRINIHIDKNNMFFAYCVFCVHIMNVWSKTVSYSHYNTDSKYIAIVFSISILAVVEKYLELLFIFIRINEIIEV